MVGESKPRLFTRDEINKHNCNDDLWAVIDNYVVDITNFTQLHPGGLGRAVADFKWELARGLVKLTNPRFAGLELAIARDEPLFADGGEKLHLKNDRVPSVLTFNKSARLNKIHNGSFCDHQATLSSGAVRLSCEGENDPTLEQREVKRAGIERMAGKFFNKLHADILGITEEEYMTYQQGKDPETGQRLKFSNDSFYGSHSLFEAK